MDLLQRFRPRAGFDDLKTGGHEHACGCVPGCFVVIDVQDQALFCHCSRAPASAATSDRMVLSMSLGVSYWNGIVNVKVEPSPGWLAAVSVPPISSASLRESGRPRPV